ncbi:MAG: DUF308 domain-containing protein [Bacteroidales bacterium]|nr:DUF308 domain-containing protein [Bacteroidales bacterium]
MKTIRLLAGLLLVISGVLHIAMYFKVPNDPGSIGMLVFGIIYGLTGLLLFTPKMYPVYLGLIFPLIGMTVALIKFGFPVLVSMMTLLYLIDVIVIICCVFLIVNRKKASEVTN